MVAPCVQVQGLCVAPAYAAAMAPEALIIGPAKPDAARAAAIARLGASIDVVLSDCMGCIDIHRYRVTCRNQACVAVGDVGRHGTTLTLNWSALPKSEPPARQATLFLVVKATSPAALRDAVAAIALDTDAAGVAIPLREVLARSSVRLP